MSTIETVAAWVVGIVIADLIIKAVRDRRDK